MKRLTLDEVREAFATTGLRPVRYVTLQADDMAACALGAVARARGMVAPSLLTIGPALGLSDDYVGGVVRGWDGRPPLTVDTAGKLSPATRAGLVDGAVFAAALVYGQGAQ
jgi:hypothetical protein